MHFIYQHWFLFISLVAILGGVVALAIEAAKAPIVSDRAPGE